MSRWFFRRQPEYVYGTAGRDGRAARKHRSGQVEFLLWRAGEQGHVRDYWVPFHSYWWPTFTPSADEPRS